QRASATARYWTLLTTMLLIAIVPIGTWQFLPSKARQFATPLSQESLDSRELVGNRHEPSGDGSAREFLDEERGGLHGNASSPIPPQILEVVPTKEASTPRKEPWSAV